MTHVSTIMTWVAVVLFLGAYAFPLWSISLDAPQYPEGMGMRIWIDKITGEKPHDLKNINGLNHYIGMKEIHAESIPELLIMKYIVGCLIFLGVVAALMRKRRLLVAWVIISVIVALGGLVDFYRWGYDYGHDLDPDAPIKVPGMTYQPPLIGSKQLLNITATSFPALGGIMMIAGVTLGFIAVIVERRQTRRTRRAAPVAVIAVLALIASCSVEPSPIRFGTDTCDYCRMTIADERFGSEIVTNKGRVYKYDAVECMAGALIEGNINEETVALLLTVDHSNPTVLVDATKAVYLHSPTLRSPMGLNLTSFAGRADAEETARRHPGHMLAWNQVKKLVQESHRRAKGHDQ
jgi:copper chaperone NosL